MSKAKPVRLSGLLVLAAALAVVAGLSWGHLGAGSSHAGSTGGTMVVDCDADTAGVQSDCSYAPGGTFNVAVVATPGSGGVFGLQLKLAWVLNAVNYAPTENPGDEASWGANCGVPARSIGTNDVLFGCVPFPLPANGITEVATLTFAMSCKSDFSGVSAPPGLDNNQSSLTLVPREGDPQLGSHFLDVNLAPIDPTLTNATVTCEEQPTPTEGPPPTDGSPTPTPPPCGTAGCTEFDSGDATIAVGESTVLTFTVTDLAGNPAEGVECSFSVDSGDGTVDPATGTSDADGHVTTTLTAGDTVGEVVVVADCGDYGSSVLAVDVSAAALPGTGLTDGTDNGMSTVAWAIAGLLLAAAVGGLGFFGWRYARYDRQV
jgi:hypothetical protein